MKATSSCSGSPPRWAPPTIARVSPCPDTSSRRPCTTSTGKCPTTSLRVHATEVRNEAEWHHAFSGYLETPEVRDAIYARLSERARRRLNPAGDLAGRT